MAFQIGAIGTIFILWIMVIRLYSRVESDRKSFRGAFLNLQSDVNRNNIGHNDWSSQLNEDIRTQYQQMRYLDDKIDTLLELLIQEHEESVK